MYNLALTSAWRSSPPNAKLLRIRSSLESISKVFGGRKSNNVADAPATKADFYFFHIPKTAGTSIYRFLESVFPPNEICPGWLWDQIIRIPQPELRNYRLFRGHFYGYLEPYLGKPLKKLTVLRDPIERSISHYAHVRREPSHPFHAQARSRSLREFCLADDTRHLIENFQAQCLATLYLNPVNVARNMGENDLAAFQLETAIERMLYLTRDPQLLLHASMASLQLFEAVGITEDFASSVASFCTLFNSPMQNAPRENVTPERPAASDLDDVTLETIRDLVAVDATLHAYVSRRFFESVSSTRPNQPTLAPQFR